MIEIETAEQLTPGDINTRPYIICVYDQEAGGIFHTVLSEGFIINVRASLE